MLEPVRLPSLRENPLVSVLISNYNYADYLEEAIDRVLQQDYYNIEIIICDDGSTDHSVELLRSFETTGDPRIIVLTKENRGQASAVNAAFRESKGEIICFLDSDDG